MRISRLIAAALLLFTLAPAKADLTSQKCLDHLYSRMSAADSTDRTSDFYIQYAINPALKAKAELPWGKSVSDSLFLEYVLPIRINNEALDKHRPVIYTELYDRIKNLSMAQAILEINHWCHEYVSYQPSDGRTHSPLQSMSSGIGRCGEESTFTVAALRTMGIPARQVYTPRWAHTDDNHAWVEAWADGVWYFLGACEPEPILNLGWFNEPASRGMFMHARMFDKVPRAVNVTDNYAPVDTLTVTVISAEGIPLEDATVTFRLYNYAELYPIATNKSDAKGETSIVSGLGDVVVWASHDDKFGFKKISVGKTKRDTVTLNLTPASQFTANFDLVPPRQSKSLPFVSDSLRKANNQRLIYEDSIRHSHINRHLSTPPSSLNITDSTLYRRASSIYTLARGNHAEITAFLNRIPMAQFPQALDMLENITEKDLSDISCDILLDHWASPNVDTPLFAAYIQSPRIANEELTPFRSFFRSAVSPAKAAEYRANPNRWIKWVKDSITADLSWYPSQITMSPASVWRHRHTSAPSRDLFFVAGARSFGIPARIDPVTSIPQWADSTNQWHDVIFEAVATDANELKSPLKIIYRPGDDARQPKYYANYTLSAINEGQPTLLNYPEFITCEELFSSPQHLIPGQYLMTTGTRLADGTVLASIKSIILPEDTTTLTIDTLTLRDDHSALKVIGSLNAEDFYQPADSEEPKSILSSTGRGYYTLILAQDNHEPSNHVIRDITAAAETLQDTGRPIIILSDNHSLPTPDFIIKGSDINSSIAKEILASLEIESTQYPIVVIADTFNRIIFFSQGYTIGIGDRIADILRRLTAK